MVRMFVVIYCIIGGRFSQDTQMPMPTPADIAHQRELLTIHRRTLAHFLRQLAIHTLAYAPPSVIHGIRAALTASWVIDLKTRQLFSPTTCWSPVSRR